MNRSSVGPGARASIVIVVVLAIVGFAWDIYLIAPLDLGVPLPEAYLMLRSAWVGLPIVGALWAVASLGIAWLLTRRLTRRHRVRIPFHAARYALFAYGCTTLLSLLPMSSMMRSIDTAVPFDLRDGEVLPLWLLLFVGGLIAMAVAVVLTLMGRLSSGTVDDATDTK